jgi:hypothetical protein
MLIPMNGKMPSRKKCFGGISRRICLTTQTLRKETPKIPSDRKSAADSGGQRSGDSGAIICFPGKLIDQSDKFDIKTLRHKAMNRQFVFQNK